MGKKHRGERKVSPSETPVAEAASTEMVIEAEPASVETEAVPVETTAQASASEPVSGELAAIVERLRLGRCVLCAGSRLAQGGWRALVEKLIAGLPDVDRGDAESVLSRRPLAAAGFVRRRLGDGFASRLRQATAAQAELPEAVQLLSALPFRAIVTTSYDDTFERAFAKDGALPKVYTPADADALKQDGKARFVLKALGDAAREETVVWSAEDLQSALAGGSYRAVTHDLYRSRSFLFVGFEGQDPDLGILLERVLAGARSPKDGDVEHYALLPGLTSIEKEELYAAYRIRVLEASDVTALARALKDAIGDQLEPPLPDDHDAEGWLALLAEDPHRADALDRLDALERRLREAGDHESLVDLILGRVGIEPEAAKRAAMLLEVARLFESEVGDLSKAFTAVLAAYKEDWQESAWSELERLASATGMWSDLLAELAEVVPTLPESDRASAWVKIGRLYGDKLGHVEYALSSLEEALKIDPLRTDAIDLQITFLRRAERWKDLAAALSRRADREESSERRGELYLEQADIHESRLGDGAEAQASYRRALEADPSANEARAALEALLRRRGEWRELVKLLEEKGQELSGDEAIEARREVAELYAERLGDRKTAIERYEALRSDAPGELQVLRALERLYEQDGRHEDYLEVLGLQAEAAQKEHEKAALYRRMAALWEEHPGGAARAAECLERLLAVDARSEDAFRSLERLYRAEHKWSELIEAFRRHAAIVPAPIRGEIYAQVGAIYETELRDVPRAIEAYLDVESALPNHQEALAALGRLYERTEAWEKTVDVLERRALLAEVKSQKVELTHRAGELTAERLGDAKQAEVRFVRALELDPTHVPSMAGLVEIYRKNGEFLKAAQLLVEAVAHTQNRLERTRMLVEAGEIYEGLEDHKKAIDLYLEALAGDPEHVEAGERVAELLWQARRHQDLVPVLEMLTRKEAEPNVTVERLTRLGASAQALGLTDKVQKAYGRAVELDPTLKEAQAARAELAFAREDFTEARAAYEKVFEHHVDDLPPSERVELFYRLGACELKLARKDRAREWLGRALELDPAHRASLLAMMELGEAKPESLIDAKKALLQTALEDERVKLLTEIGDLYLEKLEDPSSAVGAWREALELKPDDHKLLHKSLDVYVEQKQWAQGMEMLDRLIAIEKSPSVRAKYRHAAGLICRDELGKPDQAAELLTLALEDDPALDRSAEALEELYRERQNWKELARFYRKALKRLGPETEGAESGNAERLRLWSALGEVCLEKLGERESALAALEVALTFDRGNLDRHRQLADLYVQAGPDRFDKAIVEHQILLRAEKQRVISYRALKHLYIQTGQRDKSVACSYALTFLKKGEPDDVQKVAELKARSGGTTPLQLARRPLNDELWGRLQHPDENRYLSALFQIVTPLVAVAQAQPHKSYNLQRKDALDPADPRSIAKALKYVSGTLAAPAPEAYLKPEQKEAVSFLSCLDKQTLVPVFVIGQPLLEGKRNERELVFELARRIAHLRAERLIRYALPQPAQLAHVIETAMLLGEMGTEKGSSQPNPIGELAKTAQGLRRTLTPPQLEQVVSIGRTLRAGGEKSEQAALAWLQASDLTASRAALALGGDLETCARVLAAEPASQSALPATQRLLDLLWSSVTEELFAVRKHLGLM